jgi:hypothetical protein
MGGLQHLGLFVANRLRIEPPRSLHGGEGQHLGEVVLHHVPQGAGGFVVTGPLLHPHGLCRGDLHVFDVIAVPDRLEDRVGKAQHKNVLNRFLAQVVVDPEDLAFLGATLHDPVELLGAAVVAAEGLLDHHPAALQSASNPAAARARQPLP